MNSSQAIRFGEEDLRLFSHVSGDRNPLHLSVDFALRTAYGQRVVFGVLGCLASFGNLGRFARACKRLVVDFHRPMFLNVNYRSESTQSRNGIVVRLLDGSIPVVTTSIQFAEEDRTSWALIDDSVFPRFVPRVMSWDDLRVGQEFGGQYYPDKTSFRQFCERWSLELEPLVMGALLWASYFVGMEMPGQNALFFRIALDFHEKSESGRAFHFHSRISGLNSSLAQARVGFELKQGQVRLASGQITSFVRPDLPALRFSEAECARTNNLKGKVAVVVGASRGLGAALAMSLASNGAKVISVARSEAQWVADLPPDLQESITCWSGDARDTNSLRELDGMLKQQFGKLDFLVCSAFPSIPSLRLEPNAASRIQEYLARATDLVLAPLCQLLPLLSLSEGCGILISSSAVEKPVRDWPHYVAAKAAAESLFRTSPLQYPNTRSLIVRPERLLTELTNTPMGRQGATSPMALALRIGRSLQAPPPLGTCEILRLEECEDHEVQGMEACLEMKDCH